jgi:hypothetical protein
MTEREDQYYLALYRKSRKNRNTILEALRWLEENCTGSTRKAIRHQMDADSWQLTQELKLRTVFKNILKRDRQRGQVDLPKGTVRRGKKKPGSSITFTTTSGGDNGMVRKPKREKHYEAAIIRARNKDEARGIARQQGITGVTIRATSLERDGNGKRVYNAIGMKWFNVP